MQEKALLSLKIYSVKRLNIKDENSVKSQLHFLYLQHYLDYFIFSMIITARSFC